MAFISPLHLFKLLTSSEPRSCKKKISIITWSCSLGLGIVGKDMYNCILKWCSDFKSIFVHESRARCPHFAITASVDFVVYLAEVVDTGARRPTFDSDLWIHGNAEKAY